MCDNILKSNSASQKYVIDAYKTVLESIKEQLNHENITPELRMQLTNKMIEVADKISEKDTENKKWLKGLFKTGVGLLGLALIGAAAVLGVNIKGHDIPTLDDDTDDDDNNENDDDIIDVDYSEDDE